MTALEEAVRHAESLPAPADITRQLTGLETEIERAMKRRKDLLGVQREEAADLDARIAELQRQHQSMAWRSTGLPYRRMSLEPLRWRNEKGYPRLALFSLDSPEFRITTRGSEMPFCVLIGAGLGATLWAVGGLLVYSLLHTHLQGIATGLVAMAFILFGGLFGIFCAIHLLHRHSWWIHPFLPRRLQACYRPVCEGLRAAGTRNGVAYTIRARFSGQIPPEALKKIREAQRRFGRRNVLLLAEPQRWSLEKTAIPHRDPLVVGWDGGGLWLVHQFECTPVENLAAREFTS